MTDEDIDREEAFYADRDASKLADHLLAERCPDDAPVRVPFWKRLWRAYRPGMRHHLNLK